MAHDVFISYAAEDKPTADAVCATLEARDIRCWIAPRDVTPGVTWASAIVQAIHGSRVLVLVFSARSNGSPQVLREVERAVSVAIPILPVRIDDVIPSDAMEYFLGAPHWLDAMSPPLERHLDRLATTVAFLLNPVEPTASAREASGPAPATAAMPVPRPAPRRLGRRHLLLAGGGVVAAITAVLAQHGGNVEDIRMATMGELFTMIALVNLEGMQGDFVSLQAALAASGSQLGVQATMQRREIWLLRTFAGAGDADS